MQKLWAMFTCVHTIMTIFISLTYSINNFNELKENLDQTIVDKRNTFKNDFNYNEYCLVGIKMPYINCNRVIFANDNVDLLDMFMTDCPDYLNEILLEMETVSLKIRDIVYTIDDMFVSRDSFTFDTNMISVSNASAKIEMSQKIKKYLNMEFIELNNILSNNIVSKILGNKLYKIFEPINNYIFKSIKFNIFIYQINPSFVLGTIFNNKEISIVELKKFLYSLSKLYKYIDNNIKEYKKRFLKMQGLNFTIFAYTSYMLVNNIRMKWIIELQKYCVFDFFGVSKKRGNNLRMPIYSINADDIISKLEEIIEIILGAEYNEIHSNIDINKAILPNYMFHVSEFISYEVIILNKKYIINIFDMQNLIFLPSGFVAAHLNINCYFKSVGFVGYIESSQKCLFLSVEEKSDLFIKLNNLNIFENNEDQIFYFMLDFLNILDELHTHRIQLMSSNMVFAVIKAPNRWRFRVDDICTFNYAKGITSCNNLKVLIYTINSLLSIIKTVRIFEFLEELKHTAEILKNADYDYYIEILILKLEKKLNDIKEEQISTAYYLRQ